MMKLLLGIGVVVCVTVCQIFASELQTNQQSALLSRQERGLRKKGKCQWEFTACQTIEGKCGQGTKKGRRIGEGCEAMPEKTFSCSVSCSHDIALGDAAVVEKRCKYKKSEWSDCDPVTKTKTRVMPLKRDVDGCSKEKTETKPCRIKNKDGKKENACRYNKGEWSGCTNNEEKETRTDTLKEHKSSPECEKTRTKERKCRKNKKGKDKANKDCKYQSGEWSECDETTNLRQKVKTLKKGDLKTCNKTITITKPCKKASKPCKYAKERWGDCDPSTNTKTKVLTLKKGNPKICQQRKLLKKKCKKNKKNGKKRTSNKNTEACRYEKGEWSGCDDPDDVEETRTDTLKEHKSEANCPGTREKKRKCKTGCKYTYTWSAECDSRNMRTRTMTLLSGPDNCERTRTDSKSCFKKNGKESCFYGPWGDWSACENSQKKKTREVVYGGDRCKKGAMKVKKCRK